MGKKNQKHHHQRHQPSWWEIWNGWMACTSLGKTWMAPPLEAEDDLHTKAERIETCLADVPVNIWELRELALSKGGLLTPAFRQRAWPLLVGLSNHTSQPLLSDDNHETSKSNAPRANSSSSRPPLASSSSSALADSTNKRMTPNNNPLLFDQQEEKKSSGGYYDASIDLIRRDVNRSVVFRYATSGGGSNSSKVTPSYASERLALALTNTIQTSPFHSPQRKALTSSSQPHHHQQQQQYFHYYQGLHDVAGVVLHQLDYQADLGTAILQKLAQSHWRDALRENFGNLTWILNHLFLPLVEQVDRHVHYQLLSLQVEMSNLILPWMITWLTHDIFHAETAGRLVDAFMVSHPMLPLYVSVALLVHPHCGRPLILGSDGDDDEQDPASLFVAMKQLPKYIVSDEDDEDDHKLGGRAFVRVQELLDDALAMLNKYPPQSLLELIPEDIMPRASVLQRANSISMFQAVRSWTVASPSVVSPLGPMTTSSQYTRSKLASGVPLLMDTVGMNWYIHRQRIEQARRKNRRTKLQKWTRMLLGK